WCKDVEFTQRIAYSLDGGKTLQKIPEACIETICSVNRDPKVFYHDKSNAYIMVLWLEEADYGIFRSTDMMHWQMQQKVTIADTWECPDLFCLKVEEGKEKWVFWTASGVYIVGDFDGYTFTQTGGPKNAYISQLPYAAQTYSNIANRVVSIPWLRLDNDGRSYTGSYGIPVEFSLKNTEAGYTLVQKPVRELWQNCEEIEAPLQDSMVIVTKEERELYTFEINETLVSYNAQSGILQVGKETYNLQNGYKEILFILDDNILEMFFDGGISAGSFALNSNQESFSTDISCKFYKIK
ncbi:MAG: glycoside hydrolase family 32 protein, partial [Firmicutes bacterium]|nr:glycoside hydrolase family 32 protein [Bacillota bacterium]